MSHAIKSKKLFWFLILAGLLLAAPQALLAPAGGPAADTLVINEFVTANQAGPTDEDGELSDWIEIYNPQDRPVSLAGWSLTDEPGQPDKWSFPDVTLGSRAYLLVFASGKNRTGPQLHTNFKLNHTGEFLGLYNTLEGQFVDKISPGYPRQFTDVAYGRYPLRPNSAASDLAFGYLAAATPGQPNVESPLWQGLTAPVEFSRQRGFFETPFTLELSTTTPGATIRYTTDGSAPTATHGTLYTGPLAISATTLLRAVAIKPNFRPAPVSTHTYIFIDDVPAQPDTPPGFPQSWGGYKGALVAADYEMDPDITGHPRYGSQLKGALTAIPTLSLVTDMQSFHDLYANSRRRGRAWERPVSVEFFDPQGREPGFQIDAGVRIQGELGRAPYMPKHGFRLFFRSDYGAAKLNYPFFSDSPIEEFDTLVLRGGVNRSYAGYPKREEEIRRTTYTRDEWLRASQIAMSGSGSRGRFVHLYLNGLYWGLYNVVERPDEDFMAAYFGGTKEDWQAISHQETVSNSSRRFKALHKLAAAGQLENPQQYALAAAYLDIPHFIDYLILNWYAGNLDWGFNNWYAGVPRQSGPIRYFVWDGERTWFDGAEIYMELDEYLDRPNLVKPLLAALLENPDFRMALADRLYLHLFNNGALAQANAQARWQSINKGIEQAVIAESARWGDTRFDSPLTQADWFRARDDVLAQMENNNDLLIELARKAGYYPNLDPPHFNRQSGPVASGFNVTMSAAAGQIYYTTDGSDPRLAVTGEVSAQAKQYRQPLVITATTQIKARARQADAWSALNQAVFRVGQSTSYPLQITELMYNPPGGDDYEFIELKNTGLVELPLAGASFEGINFAFPAHTEPLPPGQVLVLARNPSAFARQYPGVPVAGVYEGQLSNQGENITLSDPHGNLLLSLEYDDANGWPLSADGRGDSLVLVHPHQNPNQADNWRASAAPNGSPGADEPQIYSRHR